MARVTHVKKAQQRYHTKPVIDPATGEQKKVPVMNSRGGQKTTKGGRPVFLRLMERDLDRPKPLFRCDFCKEEIALGTPYKWIEPHGRGMMTRHESCPTWQAWEYSNSLSARIAQIQDGEPEGDTVDDVRGWLESKAEEIRSLAEEKREAAQNIEDGFQHATYQSDELNDIADQLDSWADELEQVEIPDLPEPEDEDCDACGGTGTVAMEDGDENCEECDGAGTFTGDDPTEEQMEEWREEALSAAREALDNCPV